MTRYRRYSNPYSIDVQRYSIYHKKERRSGRAPQVGDEFTVTVEDMDSSGCGIAMRHGFTVVIPKAVPGEKVRVRVVKVKGKQVLASVIKRIAEPRR